MKLLNCFGKQMVHELHCSSKRLGVYDFKPWLKQSLARLYYLTRAPFSCKPNGWDKKKMLTVVPFSYWCSWILLFFLWNDIQIVYSNGILLEFQVIRPWLLF